MRAITAENEKKRREEFLKKAKKDGYLLPEDLKDSEGNWLYKIGGIAIFKMRFALNSWHNSQYTIWYAPTHQVDHRAWNHDEYTFMPEDSTYVGKYITLDSSYLSCGVKSLNGIDNLYSSFRSKTKEALALFINAFSTEFKNRYPNASLVNPNGIILISTEIPRPSEVRGSFNTSRFDRRDYLNENFDKLDLRVINPNSSNLIQVWGYAEEPYKEEEKEKKDE